MTEQPYNPLDKRNLGANVAKAMLHREPVALPLTEFFTGAGICAIYYAGNFPSYGTIAAKNQERSG